MGGTKTASWIGARARMLLVSVVAVSMLVVPAPASATDPDPTVDLQAEDPLGLLPGFDVLRQYSLGPDTTEVWTCDLDLSASHYVEILRETVTPWFEHHSRGRYRPVFSVGGDIASPEVGITCTGQIADASSGETESMMELGSYGISHGSPGYNCGFEPCPGAQTWGSTRRGTTISPFQSFTSVAVHEIGHSLRWPHSFVEREDDPDIPDEYDNVTDVMSGNWGRWTDDEGRETTGTHPDPYDTAVINRYAAGWIDPHEVYVMSGGGAAFDLTTAAGDGHQMAVIRAGDSFYTLGARVSGQYDPIPATWVGVEVYRVVPCPLSDGHACEANDDFSGGFRRIIPEPATAVDRFDDAVFTEPVPHVIPVGGTRMVGGVPVAVTGSVTHGFRVSVGDEPVPIPLPVRGFVDTFGHTFETDIAWLAGEDITKGCNPPANDRFCPDDPVTRGQMAAFLVRALGLTDTGTGFTDTTTNVFAADISRLAAADITRGCNPPTNDRFCPDDPVTRGQMAAFLRRALGPVSP